MGNLCCCCCCCSSKQQNNVASVEPLIEHDHNESRNQSANEFRIRPASNAASINVNSNTAAITHTESSDAEYYALSVRNTPASSAKTRSIYSDLLGNETVYTNLINKVQTIYVKPLPVSVPINYKKVRTMSKIRLKGSVNFYKSVYDRENERLLVCDVRNRGISEISAISSFTASHNPSNILRKPVSLSLNNKNHLIVFDQELKKFFIMNSSFKRHQDYSPALNFDFILSDLAIDKTNNNLYACDKLNGRLVIFEKSKQKVQFLRFEKDLKSFSPTFIHVHSERIYVIDSPTSDTYATSAYNYNTSQSSTSVAPRVDHSTKSAIHVIDKKTKKLLKTIRPSNWANPVGLFVDSNENIITTAYCIDKQMNITSSRFLFTISQEGKVLNRASLYFDEQLSDIDMVNDEKLFLISKNSGIHAYEFDSGVKSLTKL